MQIGYLLWKNATRDSACNRENAKTVVKIVSKFNITEFEYKHACRFRDIWIFLWRV